MNRERVMVVGGAGYIGAHIVWALLDQGNCEVAVLDNLSSGHRHNVPDSVPSYEFDMMVYSDCAQAFSDFKPTAVVHLAALKAAAESMEEPTRYAHHNISGTLTLLQVAIEQGVQKFVFSSSAAVYGTPKALPLDEQHTTEPDNFYGFTKLEIERVLEWYGRLHLLKFANLRYFNAAGYDKAGRISGLEQNPRNLVPIVMEAAVGIRKQVDVYGGDYDTADGTCVRDYIHVTDLADAHVRALNYLTDHESLMCNLGTGKGYSVLEILDVARQVTGREIVHQVVGRRFGDPPSLWASSEKAMDQLGWCPHHSDLRTIISTTWSRYTQAELLAERG